MRMNLLRAAVLTATCLVAQGAAQAQVVIADMGEEFAEQGVVFRLHRAHQRQAVVGQGDHAFPFPGIRQDGEARMPVAKVQARQRGHGHTRIHGDHAFLVGQQRVDVQLGKLRDIGCHLRQLHQHQGHGERCAASGVPQAPRVAVCQGPW